MTAPAYASVGTAGVGNTNAPTAGKPSGTVDGDLLIAVYNGDNNGITCTNWQGFTQGGSGGSTQDGQTAIWAYKIASSEPASWTPTFSTTNQCTLVVLRYTGNHLTTPIVDTPTVNSSSAANASPANVTATGLTTSVADTLLVWVCANDDIGGASGHTAPSGFSALRYDSSSLNSALGIADAAQAVAGASGNKTGTASASSTIGWIAFLIPIQPPAAGGGANDDDAVLDG